jgi:RHS repeat-associated protein
MPAVPSPNNFFAWGQTLSSSDYYYTRNHLGSVLDVTDSSANVQAHYEYDPYGQVTQTVGTLSSDLQYAGYYFHAPSGLNLTTFRAYSPTLGRWINRDPIEERGGVNLYAYVENDPVDLTDPSGLASKDKRFVPKFPPAFCDCNSGQCCQVRHTDCLSRCRQFYIGDYPTGLLRSCLNCCENQLTSCEKTVPTTYAGSMWNNCFQQYPNQPPWKKLPEPHAREGL